MEHDRYGLSSDEREHLTGQLRLENQMDVKMSLLAFAGLFLICALIIAASVIAGLQQTSEAPDARAIPPRNHIITPSRTEQEQRSDETPPADEASSSHEVPAPVSVE